ncbi:MAG: nuclear transport factor 2 family protein [Ideonella sp.]|nr:nuclear transport factor 2 family protein [Ideonella sp.]
MLSSPRTLAPVATLLLWATLASGAQAQAAPAPATNTTSNSAANSAPTDTPEALQASLKAMDDTVFEKGFNHCNVAALASALHPELEFVHDKSGISRHDDFLHAFRTGLCGQPGYQSTRRLIPGTMQVFALHNKGQLYGAVQMGEHEFYETLTGQAPRFASRARFVHTWLWVDGRWKLYRALSFDHR